MPMMLTRTAETTKISSFTRYGCRPRTRTRSSFSRTAAATWPAREDCTQVTTTNTATSTARASQ